MLARALGVGVTTMLATMAGAGCLHHSTPASTAADRAEGAIRQVYGDSIRRVQHGEAGSLVRTALAAAPPCAWETAGTGGYLMIVDDREVTEEDALIVTTILCNQPSRFPSVYRRSERWQLEHRGGRWVVTSRTGLQES